MARSISVGNSLAIRMIVAFGIATLLIFILVVAIGWEDVFDTVSRAAFLIYGLAFVLSSWCLLMRAYVWHRVLGAVDQRRPYWLVGSVFLTGMFAKYITPYGQVTSGVGVAAVVTRYYESAYEESLAGIVTADFLNYTPYYSFGGIGLVYVILVGAPIPIDDYVLLGIIGIGAIAVLIGLLWIFRTTVLRLGLRLLRSVRYALHRVSPRYAERLSAKNIAERFRGFSITLALLSRDRETVLIATLCAHLAWLGLAGALYFSARSLGFALPLGIVFLCVALSKVGFIVPTPGGVGGVEIALASVLFLLTPMGGAAATAVAILYRVATYWFTILVGGMSSVALTLSDPTPP